MPERGLTRRRLLHGALSGGAAVAVLAGVAPGARSGAAFAADEDDGAILLDLAGMEQLSIAILGRVLSSSHLSPPEQALARLILGQEQAHLRTLAGELARRRRSLPAPPTSTDQIDQALSDRHADRQVEDLGDEHACLDLLLATESIAEGALYSSLSKLHDPALLSLAAGVLADEAQHEALLGELRFPKNFDQAAPYPYVEGIH